MSKCECPEEASVEIGTWDDPFLMLCNCCGKVWHRNPAPVVLHPWDRPGHVCLCGGN